ncbi:MAG: MBL fold metallo-hydrolase [Alphaproteobacteria bacterium]|nr:MBL fold metallo-hydrolase [Alphaproteobacteria bacterium]MBU6471045.1 MBL fold metallo-hydrolase [Alphaproteobacteria bacterium]MDE2013144.1 MBL fold metallo-hydrolase [Alphaproteobacteria bacterium]MDE2072761.1 MBL fold metallo-hydrolase [Alphaproteobacteria bacterium]MDE2352135.1 MBL fold metallo-hydrolase [Alphaproteobacteria bacterium]
MNNMDDVVRLVAEDDRKDFDFANRGFIATRKDPKIMREDGRTAFDLSSYGFLEKGAAPESANPSLWRQAQILTKHGLFKVAERIYQVRGFDVSTVSFIDAGAGWIVVDPLTTVEVARAALDLVREHVACKPVLAVIYSHSHVDHYGGVGGITNAADVAAGKVRVIAPEGFLEHAVSENIIAGPAMMRRARFQFGITLPRSAEGEMTSGLGPCPSLGSISLIAPTDLITHTGQEITVGDMTLVFQLTPGTEAPAEMNFYLPSMRAVFMAENANLTMHNLLPARGALVRDAKAWADYLTESIRLFGDKSEVMFAAHGIPRFGQGEIVAFLSSHRDAYKFLHDQTVRLMNSGLTSTEIAEVLELPQVLAKQWFNRGYYGTMSHNSKAIYQRYLGWYDANPANLNPLPPEPAAKKYVAVMGGAGKVMAEAESAVKAGELRWAATLLNHLVFADEHNMAARNLLADVYTRMGFEAEAGTWRNIYLTGAQELRDGPVQLPPGGFNPDVLAATTTAMVLDFAAVRVNPEKAAAQSFKINIELADRGERHLLTVGNGVLVHEEGVSDPKADLSLGMKRPDLLMSLFLGLPLAPRIESGDVTAKGDVALYAALVEMIEPLSLNFPIVTP